jgi:hypothetical protein
MKNIGALLIETSIVGNESYLTNEAKNSLLTAYESYIIACKDAVKNSAQYDNIAEFF